MVRASFLNDPKLDCKLATGRPAALELALRGSSARPGHVHSQRSDTLPSLASHALWRPQVATLECAFVPGPWSPMATPVATMRSSRQWVARARCKVQISRAMSRATSRGSNGITTGRLMSKILLSVVLLCLLAACGQKGDLYLPDESDKKQDFVAH